MIPKREYNTQLSVFSNLTLDLIDFKDRVRPMAKDISLIELSSKYQKLPAEEIVKQREQMQADVELTERLQPKSIQYSKTKTLE